MTTNSPGSTARKNSSQQVGYLRFTVNWNDVGIAAGVGKQWLPAGAVIVGTDVVIATGFNAATTNVLSVGTEAATYANIVTSAQTVSQTPGLKANLPPTGAALGAIAADAQVFALYTQTGAAATAGQAIVIIKYVYNNDL